MIKLDHINPIKYLCCDSCGKENIPLLRIKAFDKRDDNRNAVTLCKNCLDDLRKVLIGR